MTEKGLESLYGLSELRRLELEGLNRQAITDEAVQKLKAALPLCHVSVDFVAAPNDPGSDIDEDDA